MAPTYPQFTSCSLFFSMYFNITLSLSSLRAYFVKLQVAFILSARKTMTSPAIVVHHCDWAFLVCRLGVGSIKGDLSFWHAAEFKSGNG